MPVNTLYRDPKTGRWTKTPPPEAFIVVDKYRQPKYRAKDRVTDRNGRVWLFNELFGTFSNVLQSGFSDPEYFSVDALNKKHGPLTRVKRPSERSLVDLGQEIEAIFDRNGLDPLGRLTLSADEGEVVREFLDRVAERHFPLGIKAIEPFDEVVDAFENVIALPNRRRGPRDRRHVQDDVLAEIGGLRRMTAGRNAGGIYIASSGRRFDDKPWEYLPVVRSDSHRV
jgi:hypothetical protein